MVKARIAGPDPPCDRQRCLCVAALRYEVLFCLTGSKCASLPLSLLASFEVPTYQDTAGHWGDGRSIYPAIGQMLIDKIDIFTLSVDPDQVGT